MIELKIPVLSAIRYMVYEDKSPLRGFATKPEADEFVKNDPDLKIVRIRKKFKTYVVEEAPF